MIRGAVALVVCLGLALPVLAQDTDSRRSRIDELIAWLADTDDGVRWEGALLLGEIGPPAARAVPWLVKALDDPSGEVRLEVVSALERIGPPAAVPALAKALESPHGDVRLRAARSLGVMDGAAASAVPALTRALDDPRPDVRLAAAMALGHIGRRAAPAVPSLSRALGDADVGVVDAAACALGRIGGRAAVSALVGALESRSEDVRELAAIALAGDGAADRPCPITADAAEVAVPALVHALDDPISDVRATAAEALGNARFMPDSAVPALFRALDDPEILVRSTAARALGSFRSAAAPAVPALVNALRDGDLGAAPHSPLPRSGTEPGAVRLRAAQALGEIGSPAASAVPALIEALGDPVAEVRMSARSSLDALGQALRQEGIVVWWVVPRVYARELVGLAVLVVVWFALAARVPRHRPASRLKHVALVALTAMAPALLCCSATGYAVTRDWAPGFLPEAVLTVVPFPAATVLSVGFLCVLAAVWVCGRKQGTEPSAGPTRSIPGATTGTRTLDETDRTDPT